MPKDKEKPDFFEEEEEVPGLSAAAKIARGSIAAIVLIGLVYISGVHQYFFLQRTSPDIRQESVQSAVNAERITISITVYIVRNSGVYGSERTAEDVSRLVAEASRVWEQASISLMVRGVYEVEKTDEEIGMLFQNAGVFARGLPHPHMEDKSIHAVLVRNLQGLNGVAFGSVPLVAVADYTSVYDFRVLAHEIGHKLGLQHVVNEKRLMHQGANGFELSLREITAARNIARKYQ
jgi:hypothetical protein